MKRGYVMSLENLIDERNINLFSKSKTKLEVLAEISNLLKTNGYIADDQIFLQDVLKREDLGPTGMENGIAIPHGESDAVLQATIAIFRTEELLSWESLDDKPINFIFLIAVPNEDRDVEHLKILSSLSALLTHEDVQNDLLLVKNVEELSNILLKAKEIIV